MTTAPFLADLARVCRRTRVHSADAAGTPGGAARRDVVVQLLNDLLASELIWLLRYRRRFLMWGRKPELSGELGTEEQTPADRLAQRIVELGGEPDFDPDQLLSRSRADYASRGSVSELIREDLRAELIVIGSYAEVIGYLGEADPTTRKMLEVNLGRERARAAHLTQILRDLESPSVENVG